MFSAFVDTFSAGSLTRRKPRTFSKSSLFLNAAGTRIAPVAYIPHLAGTAELNTRGARV